eukprot:3080502-Rhodomonas_salina.1
MSTFPTILQVWCHFCCVLLEGFHDPVALTGASQATVLLAIFFCNLRSACQEQHAFEVTAENASLLVPSMLLILLLPHVLRSSVKQRHDNEPDNWWGLAGTVFFLAGAMQQQAGDRSLAIEGRIQRDG